MKDHAACVCIMYYNTDICLSMLHAVYIVKLTIQIAKLLYPRRTSSACEQTGLSGLLEKALHSVSNPTFLCNLPVCLALSLTQQGAHLVSFPDTFWYKTSTHYEIVGYKLLALICAMWPSDFALQHLFSYPTLSHFHWMGGRCTIIIKLFNPQPALYYTSKTRSSPWALLLPPLKGLQFCQCKSIPILCL